jgi:hypothetical protein
MSFFQQHRFVIVKFIKVLKFAKSSQVKSTSSIDVHVVGRNM